MQPSVMLVVLLMLTMPFINGLMPKTATKRKDVAPNDRNAVDSEKLKRFCPNPCQSCPSPGECVRPYTGHTFFLHLR
nr:conotoxin precursor Cerm03 [Conus ebraeus]